MTPETLTHIATLAVSVGLLWKGADWVVVGAARSAQRFGVSELAIGMTVVAVGTSAPEIVVTLVAALRGQPDISVGNVVGSNIFNMGVILGGCALVRSIPTNEPLVRRDAPMLFFAGLLLIFFLRDFELQRFEGIVMIAILAGYTLYLLRRDEESPADVDEVPLGNPTWKDIPLLILGLAAVVGGAHMLVESSVQLARNVGLSEWAIGVTLVAAGTSLPELTVSFVAVLKRRPALVAGNLIGSDLFNVLGVLGLAALVRPLSINAAAQGSLWMMSSMMFLLLFFLRSGWKLSRAEGLLLVALALLRWSRDLAPAMWPM